MVTGRRGFSAMELSMVLLVVMAMTLFIIQVNSRAADRARETACTSNLEQLSVAASLYAADYDGNYPPADLAGLMTYIKNQQVFICPAADEETPAGTLQDPSADWHNEFESNYFYSPGHSSDDLPQTILFYDDVRDRHIGDTFIYVRIDGCAERAHKSHFPGEPGEPDKQEPLSEPPPPGCCGVGD